MYSEILGGSDSAKLSSNQVFYRNHFMVPRSKPEGHADGVQLHSGSHNVFFIENLVDMTYSKHNGAYWAKSTGAIASATRISTATCSAAGCTAPGSQANRILGALARPTC